MALDLYLLDPTQRPSTDQLSLPIRHETLDLLDEDSSCVSETEAQSALDLARRLNLSEQTLFRFGNSFYWLNREELRSILAGVGRRGQCEYNPNLNAFQGRLLFHLNGGEISLQQGRIQRLEFGATLEASLPLNRHFSFVPQLGFFYNQYSLRLLLAPRGDLSPSIYDTSNIMGLLGALFNVSLVRPTGSNRWEPTVSLEMGPQMRLGFDLSSAYSFLFGMRSSLNFIQTGIHFGYTHFFNLPLSTERISSDGFNVNFFLGIAFPRDRRNPLPPPLPPPLSSQTEVIRTPRSVSIGGARVNITPISSPIFLLDLDSDPHEPVELVRVSSPDADILATFNVPHLHLDLSNEYPCEITHIIPRGENFIYNVERRWFREIANLYIGVLPPPSPPAVSLSLERLREVTPQADRGAYTQYNIPFEIREDNTPRRIEVTTEGNLAPIQGILYQESVLRIIARPDQTHFRVARITLQESSYPAQLIAYLDGRELDRFELGLTRGVIRFPQTVDLMLPRHLSAGSHEFRIEVQRNEMSSQRLGYRTLQFVHRVELQFPPAPSLARVEVLPTRRGNRVYTEQDPLRLRIHLNRPTEVETIATLAFGDSGFSRNITLPAHPRRRFFDVEVLGANEGRSTLCRNGERWEGLLRLTPEGGTSYEVSSPIQILPSSPSSREEGASLLMDRMNFLFYLERHPAMMQIWQTIIAGDLSANFNDPTGSQRFNALSGTFNILRPFILSESSLLSREEENHLRNHLRIWLPAVNANCASHASDYQVALRRILGIWDNLQNSETTREFLRTKREQVTRILDEELNRAGIDIQHLSNCTEPINLW